MGSLGSREHKGLVGGLLVCLWIYTTPGTAKNEIQPQIIYNKDIIFCKKKKIFFLKEQVYR